MSIIPQWNDLQEKKKEREREYEEGVKAALVSLSSMLESASWQDAEA